jgi:glycine cleavage system pyridoxal-binding protein P
VLSVSWASTAKHGVDISAPADPFVPRHIGSPEGKLKEMLNVLGLKSLDEVADKTIPNSIRLRRELNLGIEEGGESSVLQRLRNIVSENKVNITILIQKKKKKTLIKFKILLVVQIVHWHRVL